MLTLMSKAALQMGGCWSANISGSSLASLVAVVVLGVVLGLGTWYRIPNDYLIRNTA